MAFTGKRLGSLFFVLSVSPACMDGIELVGLHRGGEKVLKVPPTEYIEKMGESLSTVLDSAMLASRDFREESSNPVLRWFSVGVGIEGKIGVADIVTLGARSRIRFTFVRNNN